MEAIKKLVKYTNGKKTTTSVVLLILVELLKIWKPDLMSPGVDKTVAIILNTGLIGSLGHKAFRYIEEKIHSRKANKNK